MFHNSVRAYYKNKLLLFVFLRKTFLCINIANASNKTFASGKRKHETSCKKMLHHDYTILKI